MTHMLLGDILGQASDHNCVIWGCVPPVFLSRRPGKDCEMWLKYSGLANLSLYRPGLRSRLLSRLLLLSSSALSLQDLLMRNATVNCCSLTYCPHQPSPSNSCSPSSSYFSPYSSTYSCSSPSLSLCSSPSSSSSHSLSRPGHRARCSCSSMGVVGRRCHCSRFGCNNKKVSTINSLKSCLVSCVDFAKLLFYCTVPWRKRHLPHHHAWLDHL